MRWKTINCSTSKTSTHCAVSLTSVMLKDETPTLETKQCRRNVELEARGKSNYLVGYFKTLGTTGNIFQKMRTQSKDKQRDMRTQSKDKQTDMRTQSKDKQTDNFDDSINYEKQ